MLEDPTAELEKLFGMPEGDSKEPVEDGDAPAKSGDATGKESTDQGSPEPKTEKSGEEDVRDPRIQALIEENARYKRYAPLLEMFEEEPELARQVAAKKLGLVPEQAPVVQQPVVQQPQATPQQIQEYWGNRLQQDPAGTINQLIRLAVNEATADSKNVSIRSSINTYKADRRANDPLFKHYEPVFDQFVKSANPEILAKFPDETLAVLENLALGTWAKDQRSRAAKAAKPTPKRESPQSLATNTGEKPSAPARPRKPLSDEERYLEEMYGAGSTESDEKESDSVWGR